MKLITALAFVVVLCGCASVYKPVPEGYTGPTASIADSGFRQDYSKAQMFVVAAIDGNNIANSLSATHAASFGHGIDLTTQFITRQIQARPQRVKLEGTHITAAPIVDLLTLAAGTYFSVEGEIEFNPDPGGSYIVKGELKSDGSSVWIEDAKTGERVTERVVER